MTGLAQELTDTIARMEKSDLTEFQRGVVYGFKEILRSHFATEPDPTMLDLIRQAEWAGADMDCDTDTSFPACPWCEERKTSGHTPTCPVKPLLYPEMK